MNKVRYDILLFSSMNWNDLWTRKQRFALMLSEMGHQVIYLQPRKSVRSWLKGNEVKLLGEWYEVNPNLTICTLPVALPFTGRLKWSRYLTNTYSLHTLYHLMQQKAFSTPILWSINPYLWDLLLRIKNRLFIHEVIDELSEYPNPFPGIAEVERSILKRADLVFVTAQGLLKTKGRYNPNTYLVPNGVDFEFYQVQAKISLKMPEDLKDLPKPLLGFVGGIHNWIDFQLLRQVATKRPDWSIVLVGPVGPTAEISLVDGLQNIYFLGMKSKEETPNYIGAFDVCINPFKLNKLAEYVNPLKIYEYLAMGKPVISTTMPELLSISDILYLANDPAGWIKAIEQAIIEDSDNRRSSRLKVARDHSWIKILNSALSIIENTLSDYSGEL